MKLAKHWTQICLASHEKCNHDRPPQYPSRLLSINSYPVRLVVTDDWTSTPRYATLSHSWGSQKFETLLLANLEQMQSCIPGESLTKTFADAIEIARAAGLDYLWIDSLCIIQDDHKDWVVEAAKMTSVYSGSSLNIAASSARDGTEGCFPKPRGHLWGFVHEVCVKGKMGLLEFMPAWWYDLYVEKAHLNSRAWCVQEKILAPRTLHCSNHGLYWECRTARASEDFPNGFSGVVYDVHEQSMLMHPEQQVPLGWPPVVEWYSACDLTYPGDKLVALSGVARAIMDKTRDQYVCGLWRKDLHNQLCWKALDPQPRPLYRAPSWSWAAVDGGITFDKQYTRCIGGHIYSRVRIVSVENADADPCGAVVHGMLMLDCDLVRKGTVRVAPPGLAVDGNRPPTEPRLLYADLGHKNSLFPFRLDCSEDRLGQVIYFLPLRNRPDTHKHHKDGDFDFCEFQSIFGLVVEEADGPGHGYRRIGCFEYQSCDRRYREAHESSPLFFASFRELLLTRNPGTRIINLI